MKPRREYLALLHGGADEHEVSADAALAFVRTTRRQGGVVALLVTSAFVFVEAALVYGAAKLPFLVPWAVAGAIPLGFLLKRGLRSRTTSRAIEDAFQLARPLSAVLVDRMLLLGTLGSSPEHWCAVPVTEEQERQIRRLALPGAYIRRP